MAELLGRTHNLGFQYYGPKLNRGRRILKKELNEGHVRNQWGKELGRVSIQLIQGFIHKPETFYDDVTGFVLSFFLNTQLS
jgi:hypothetical protein